jgi:hypothetical protein
MLQLTEGWPVPLAYSDQYVAPSPYSFAQPDIGSKWYAAARMDLVYEGKRVRIELDAHILNRFEAVVNQFKPLVGLRENWDSYGARHLKVEAFLAALSFMASLLTRVALVPHISLTNTGGVHLEWTHGGQGIEIDIESFKEQEAFVIDAESGDVEELEDFTPEHIALLLED